MQNITITVVVQATFGSEFQRDVARRTLKEALRVWEEATEEAHKQNKVTITET